MNWLGFDIGGANIKLADGAGFAISHPFAMWRTPEKLPTTLTEMLASAPPCGAVALTMTGELADCYATKREGVIAIVEAMRQAAGHRALSIYCTDGQFAGYDAVNDDPLRAAASNWHALASFAGRFAGQGGALLLDIGSTTTDVIGLVDGVPRPRGTTDTERLVAGELVYTGVARSLVAAIVRMVPYRGDQCCVAQELFATAKDVYVMLGDVPENLDDLDTADGRPATRSAAHVRLARMICADAEQFDEADALAVAQAVSAAQQDQILAAIARVSNTLPVRLRAIVVSGSGEFLAGRTADAVAGAADVISLSDQLGSEGSTCAAAHAVAVLANERHG